MLATPTHLDHATQASGVPTIAATVMSYVLEHVAEDITLADMAAVAGMSSSSFCRSFARACGLPPMRWLWNFRAVLAAEFIKLDPRWSLTDVAFTCGFTSSAHFSRSFKAVYGVSPLTYKKAALAALPAGKAKSGQGFTFADQDSLALRIATQVLMQKGSADA